jgi:branched-subunit amino acid aminotransferase/4-amino-4-deoxychorismate lyase
VTVAVLGRALKRLGKNLERVPLRLSHFEKADGIWLANSLMGLMPVSSLDGRSLPLSQGTNRFLMDCLAAETVRTK